MADVTFWRIGDGYHRYVVYLYLFIVTGPKQIKKVLTLKSFAGIPWNFKRIFLCTLYQ